MNFLSQRGRARLAPGSLRRRTGRFAAPMVEGLEGRLLLAAGNFGINVEISPYASFVNLLQTPGSWGDAPGDTNTLAYNSSGDPESDAALIFDLRVNQSWNGPDPNAVAPNLSGTYSLSFNGQATIQTEYPGSSTPFTVENQAYNASTNTTTAQLVVPTANYSDFFAISFLNTQATASSVTNTGISNAALIRPGYAANSTQLYTNEFLSSLQPYSTLRYLDPENTNSQPFFNGTTLVTVGASQVDQTGLPWEYLIALANETQTDMWINIPQGATNDYITALAGIFKNGGTVDGVTYPGLDSNLKIYLEYSNEVWGGIPFNEYYQEAAVQNGADNQPLSTFTGNLDVYNNVDGTTTTSVYTAVGRRYLEETADIGQIFQSVLGSDPTHQRIRPVLGWQEDDFSFWPAALQWYEHFFGPASAAFYGMGDANYVNPTDYTSVSSVLGTLQTQWTSYSIPDTTDFTTLATFFGLANVSYEGGPSISGDGTTTAGQNALAASRDPAMEQLVLQEYEDFYAAGGTLAMYYDGPFALWSPENEWGAAELAQYGDPTASAKYRGTVDVADAAPVAVTAGIAVPASGPTSFSATTDTLGDSFSLPSSGQQNFWLLNAASSGTYDLKMTTGASSGQAPGQVEVFVDDRQVGGTISVSGSATTVDLGNLPLSAGLNTLSLYVVHGSNDTSQNNSAYYQFNPVSFTLMSIASSGSLGNVATFAGSDTTTQGNWSPTYGSAGYDVLGGQTSLPSYATVTPTGQLPYIWAPSTTDVRAPQVAPGSTARVAGTWYGSTFSVDVDLTDGQAHRVSLYLLDWDSISRSERIDVLDGTSGAVLSTQTASSFTGGEYLTWTVTGNVQFRFTDLSGANAVLSGLFFGTAPQGNAATFAGSDTTTQGNWSPTYGSAGYEVIGGQTSLPSYATVTATGQSSWTWAQSTTDVRAPQVAPGATSRVAGTWYGGTFTVDVDLTDGQAHQVSLYLLDWDSTSRSERIDVLDGTTGAVLSTQTVSSFTGGEYLTWTVTGNVQFRFTDLSGANAVLSGLFFGTPPQGNTATFAGSDTTTQGNWSPTYGSAGYEVIGGQTSLPSYATVTATGQQSWTWASSTTDVRAPQVAPGATARVASTWYGSTFTVDVDLTDGQAHQVSLYLLDWDSISRSEQIDVLDGTSGAVLSTQTASSFTGGEYLTWTVTGNVQFRFTDLSGANAVLSGLFFG